MSAPTNGGTSPRIVAIATSHGSSIRRRASLYTHTAIAAQNTATKKSDRFRTSVQVPELQKPNHPLPVISSAIAILTSTLRSEEELPDEPSCDEPDPDNRDDHDHGDREHAQPLAKLPHRTFSNRLLSSC